MKIQTTQRTLKPLIATSIVCFFTVFSLGIATAEDANKKELEAEEVSVVDSGTYKVTAHIVDDEEKELYVKMEDGKILELYIKSSTKLMKGNDMVEFAAFEKGQTLEIEVTQDGDHMKPVSVKILEE